MDHGLRIILNLSECNRILNAGHPTVAGTCLDCCSSPEPGASELESSEFEASERFLDLGHLVA